MIDNKISINIHSNPDIPAFGAYLRLVEGEYKLDDPKTIILNVEACFSTADEQDWGAKEVIIETLMHEFGHALEEFFSLEVNEEKIERIVETFRKARCSVEEIMKDASKFEEDLGK